MNAAPLEKQHIRASINIPHKNADFVENVQEVAGSKDRAVIVYSASFDGDASPAAARKLGDAGFMQVYD